MNTVIVSAVPNVPMPNPFHRTSGAQMRRHPCFPNGKDSNTQALKQAPNKNRAEVTYGVAILEITTLIAVHTHDNQIATKGDNLDIYSIVPNSRRKWKG